MRHEKYDKSNDTTQMTRQNVAFVTLKEPKPTREKRGWPPLVSHNPKGALQEAFRVFEIRIQFR